MTRLSPSGFSLEQNSWPRQLPHLQESSHQHHGPQNIYLKVLGIIKIIFWENVRQVVLALDLWHGGHFCLICIVESSTLILTETNAVCSALDVMSFAVTSWIGC
ncbi:hypothetical protein GOODEAATRI_004973 [Goodea atripinnis]|uniref:Uncharacterized protein n=1 Tax=Goodea atripinnis TaxID=208336 RepID=A0ABV0PVU8_9TELE